MQPRFNIAALPIDNGFNQQLFATSSKFKSATNGYCLEPSKALPHVTLCQFRADDEAQAINLVKNFLGKRIIVQKEGIATLERPEGLWINYEVKKEEPLVRLQYEIAANLRNAEILTGRGDAYYPHFTLARVPTADKGKVIWPEDASIAAIECELKLGISDEEGQFLRVANYDLAEILTAKHER